MANRSCVVGVDLGGTNVRAQCFYPDGAPAGERVQQRSDAQSGTERILANLVDTVVKAIDLAKTAPSAIGLAIPGHIDDDAGIVVWAPNFGEVVQGVFRYWSDIDVRTPLTEATGLSVRMGNDANCAALGEYRFGVGNNEASCLVMLTLGTGVGGGVVLSPKSLQGKVERPVVLVGGNKGGGELGHISVERGGLDCYAGSYGALEAYCQRDAIITRAVHKLRRGRESILNDLSENDYSRIDPLMLSQAAEQGDDVAIETWREVGEFLGVGIGSLINVFAPDVFAIGGRISQAGDFLFEPAISEARKAAVPSLFRDCRIVPSKMIDDAGLLGGAALAWEVGDA